MNGILSNALFILYQRIFHLNNGYCVILIFEPNLHRHDLNLKSKKRDYVLNGKY